MWDNFAISKKLLKAINHPMGENSPYLVTLADGNTMIFRLF
jgi:hypothetical protein